MYEVGRLCVKLAGRDAKGRCLIVDVLDNNFVMIDGQVRRRKCNVKHLEPLDHVAKIKKNASHSEVTKVLEAMGFKTVETKKKEQKARPVKIRKSKKAEPTAEEPKGTGSKPAKAKKEKKK